MRARLTAFFILAMLPMMTHAQSSPGNVWDGFHLAIVKADRSAAESALAADVQIFESGFVERTRDEYLTHHFEADAKFAKAVKRKVIKHTEHTGGDMVLLLEETETSGSYEGKPVKLIGTETAVLRLDGGIWRIVHIHWSSRQPKT